MKCGVWLRQLLVATLASTVSGFVAGGAHLAPAVKPALQAHMIVEPAMADAMNTLDSSSVLLAKEGADALIDDFFALVWPATTVLSAGVTLVCPSSLSA